VDLGVPFFYDNVGTYMFTMTADPDNVHAECNESNNVLVRNVNVTNQPDLRVLSQYIDLTQLNPDVNEPISFDVTYDNIGGPNLLDQFSLQVEVDGVPFSEVSGLPGLLTGSNNTVPIPGSYSSSVIGVHVVRAVIDAGNSITESNEGNNEATRSFVVGPAANLFFSSFAPSGSTPTLDDWTVVQATVENGGDAPVTGSVLFAFVNSDLDTVPFGLQPITLAAFGSMSLEQPWLVVQLPVTVVGRIVNVSGLEFNYDDNQAWFTLGAFDLELASVPGCSTTPGTLTATASNGTAPYTYVWSNGALGAELAALPGSYTVSVTDANGAFASASGTIGYSNTDTDGDGTPDCSDGCPNDEDKISLGACGCGVVDVPTTWYADSDGDGFGDPLSSIGGYTCNPPTGHVANNADCDDSDPAINPAAADPCDAVDNNCNGIVDEDFIPVNCLVCVLGALVDQSTIWYADQDGDGLGDPNESLVACEPPPGYVANALDPCNFAVESINNFNSGTCACELGYYATITDINGNDVITACTICPAGSYCPDGILQNPCSPGFFSAATGQVQCDACQPGRFSAASGSQSCALCPVLTFNPLPAQVECLACPNGDDQVEGATECDGVFDCPLLGANIGASCNDDNPATINDVISEACTCAGQPVVELSVKAYLEGAFLDGTMRDDLRPSLLPVIQPYTSLGFADVLSAPFTADLGITGNDAIVDWVLVELRQAGSPVTVLHRRAALIQRDGDVVDTDGVSPLRCVGTAPGSYHVAIRHRNHLGAMTADAMSLGGSPVVVDFTANELVTYGTNATKQLVLGGPRLLWAGNASPNDRLRYTNAANDRDAILAYIIASTPPPVAVTSVVSNVYTEQDTNLDGVVKYANSQNDREIILINTNWGLTGTSATRQRLEQLP
jgi:hypothetical protein